MRTNVLGTLHVGAAAAACGARRFVLISTDKAVNPTNVMGASKRVAEMMVQDSRRRACGARSSCRCASATCWDPAARSCRSSSSRSPRGGPVTVTHPEIMRYFMTIPEAAQLVLQARR